MVYSLSDLTILDNFIDNNKYQCVRSSVEDQKFTWYKHGILYNKKSNSDTGFFFDGDEKYNMQFVNVLFDKDTRRQELKYFIPIISKLNINSQNLLRFKVNLTLNWGKQVFSGYHIDIIEDSPTPDYIIMTAVYYINTNNGFTQFKDGDKVNSVANRIVIFPGDRYHAGVTCDDEAYRLVANINWKHPLPTSR